MRRKRIKINLKKFLKEVTPLVWHLTNRYYFPYSEKIDIVDECLTVVLVKTLRKYNPKKGASFKTFYYWQVRSFLSNKYKYFHRKKREHTSYSAERDDKFIRITRLGDINLKNLLYSFKNIPE